MAKEQDPIIINFLGGLNTAFRVSDVSLSEAVSGENFDLDADFAGLNRRPSLPTILALSVAGYAQLLKANGTISTILQFNNGQIATWDLSSGITFIDSVDPSARLRGGRNSTFQLDDYVIITDLALIENVKRWDGTTFEDLPHNLSSPLKAKYCVVDRERAWFSNVVSGTPTPHVILGSKVSDPLTLTVDDRPSSNRGFDDPFFLVTPDFKPINGIEKAFGQFLFSTQNGQLFLLSGSDAQDFAIQDFHFGSSVAGDEALTNIGNDILLGLPGRIDTLSGVLQFGDVETDDVSRWIRPSVKKITEWSVAYNATEQKVYCLPKNKPELWVLHKNILSGRQEVSPWAKWTDTESGIFAETFQSNTMMTLLDANGRTETTYMAVEGGNLISLNGNTSVDWNLNSPSLKWRTGLIRIPPDDIFDVTGWINYRKLFSADITLRFIFGGVAFPSVDVNINIPESTTRKPVYGGEFYYNEGGNYYGSQFSTVIARQNLGPIGAQASHLQVEVEYSGTADIQIEEIGLRFKTASTTAAP